MFYALWACIAPVITSGRTCVLSLASNQWGGNWLLAASRDRKKVVSVTVTDKTADKGNWTTREGVTRFKGIQTQNFFAFCSSFFRTSNFSFLYSYLQEHSDNGIYITSYNLCLTGHMRMHCSYPSSPTLTLPHTGTTCLKTVHNQEIQSYKQTNVKMPVHSFFMP